MMQSPKVIVVMVRQLCEQTENHRLHFKGPHFIACESEIHKAGHRMVRTARFRLYQVLGKGDLRNGSKREQGQVYYAECWKCSVFFEWCIHGYLLLGKTGILGGGKAQVGPGPLFFFFFFVLQEIFSKVISLLGNKPLTFQPVISVHQQPPRP